MIKKDIFSKEPKSMCEVRYIAGDYYLNENRCICFLQCIKESAL